MQQAVHLYVQMPILHCKMLVGNTQTPSELHRSGAGLKRNSFIFLYAIDCTNAKCYNFKKRYNVFGVFAQLVSERYCDECGSQCNERADSEIS